MKKQTKTVKKLLSLVLCLLIAAGAFAFAPKSNALGSATLTVKVSTGSKLRIKQKTEESYFKLIITETNGEKHSYDILKNLYESNTNGRYYLKKITVVAKPEITSSISSIRIEPNVSTYSSSPSLSLTVTAEIDGTSILRTSPATFSFKEQSSAFLSGNSYVVAGGNSAYTVLPQSAAGIEFTKASESAQIENGKAEVQFEAVITDKNNLQIAGKLMLYSIRSESEANGASIGAYSGLAAFENVKTGTDDDFVIYTVTSSNSSYSKPVRTEIKVYNEKFDVAFKYYDALQSEKEVTQSGIYFSRSATAPTDVAAFLSDESGHRTFEGWNVPFDEVTSNLNVSAVYGETQPHNFGEWSVVENETCYVGGSRERTCAHCGYKEISAIPAHHTAIKTEAVAPTCTTSGLTEGSVCSACGEILVAQKTIPALGHHMTETVDEKYLVSAADCVNDAVYEKSCSRCNYTEGTFIAEGTALGHDFTKEIVDNAHLKSSATCEAKAVYYYNCSRCDAISSVETFEYGEALGHDYVGVITTRPTETEKGLATYTCTRDASHVYTLSMDLADYSGFDASLEALKEISKKDLTDESKALVEAAIAEAEALSRNLIAGVKGQDYADPLDLYKHDFGEQNLIDETKAKLDEAIKNAKTNTDGNNRDDGKTWFGGLMEWLTRLLILVRHFLSMV